MLQAEQQRAAAGRAAIGPRRLAAVSQQEGRLWLGRVVRAPRARPVTTPARRPISGRTHRGRRPPAVIHKPRLG
jgi:hypothetical protein